MVGESENCCTYTEAYNNYMPMHVYVNLPIFLMLSQIQNAVCVCHTLINRMLWFDHRFSM